MKYLIIVLSMLSPLNVAEARSPMAFRINSLISSAEIKYNLPVGLLAALIHVESSGNHKVRVYNDGKSHKTSYGLTQIQLDAAKLIQKQKAIQSGYKLTKRSIVTGPELMIPEINIDYGAGYLKWLLVNHDNNISWALTCYNSGPNSRVCKNKRYTSYVGLIFNAYMSKMAKAQ